MINLTDPLPKQNKDELSKFKIDYIEIYQFDCTLMENRILGNSEKSNCGLFKISSNGVHGWADYMIPDVEHHFDLVHWASVFMKLKGLSIYEGIRFIQNKDETWGAVRKSLAESALVDLSANLKNPSRGITLERSFLFNRSQAYFSF